MTKHEAIKRARLAAGMLVDRLDEMEHEDGLNQTETIHRAYHQLATILGEMHHGATGQDAKEIVEELLLSETS